MEGYKLNVEMAEELIPMLLYEMVNNDVITEEQANEVLNTVFDECLESNIEAKEEVNTYSLGARHNLSNSTLNGRRFCFLSLHSLHIGIMYLNCGKNTSSTCPPTIMLLSLVLGNTLLRNISLWQLGQNITER